MADTDDEHTSPQSPDNRAELERQAADKAQKDQTLAQSSEGQPVSPRPGATRVVRDRKGARRVIEVPSTGHSWDGIEEYDNPLPRWWLWTFYATIIWSVAYVIAYPAIPLLNGSTQGCWARTIARTWRPRSSDSRTRMRPSRPSW